MQQKRITPQKMMLLLFVFYLFVLSFYFVGKAFSKFISDASNSDETKVALFSPLLNSDEIDVSGISKPGDFVEKNFSIQNFKDEKISEVTIVYKIIIRTTGNLPLSFDICTKDGTSVYNVKCDGVSGKQEYVYDDENFVFSTGSKQINEYIFKVEWNSSETDAKFTSMTDAIYLSVVFTQVD